MSNNSSHNIDHRVSFIKTWKLGCVPLFIVEKGNLKYPKHPHQESHATVTFSEFGRWCNCGRSEACLCLRVWVNLQDALVLKRKTGGCWELELVRRESVSTRSGGMSLGAGLYSTGTNLQLMLLCHRLGRMLLHRLTYGWLKGGALREGRCE